MATTLSNTDAQPGTYWQWRGEKIYYVSAGETNKHNPPLLLIHGFGASTDHWRKNITDLSQDFSVWAIDLLGFGRSAKPLGEYSGQLWQAQINDFITEVIGQPVVLVGNSLGGYVALCVGAEHPESSLGVVLLNSAGPFSDNQHPVKSSGLRKIIGNTANWLFQQSWASNLLFQWTRNKRNIRKTLEKVYVDKSAVTDQLIEDIYRPSCDKGAAEVFAAVFKSKQGEKVDILLGKLKSPLLLLWGEGDPWMNCQARSAKFREYYPQLTEYFLNAGHCPHDEIPEEVDQLMREWISRDVLTKTEVNTGV